MKARELRELYKSGNARGRISERGVGKSEKSRLKGNALGRVKRLWDLVPRLELYLNSG